MIKRFQLTMPRAQKLVLVIMAARVAVHVFAATSYGYFVDEYYYLASLDRLALGYVDHPPLSIWLLWVVRTLLGDSLYAIRLPGALLGAATVYTAAQLARTMRGGPFAVVLAAFSTALIPVYLGINKFYSMNSIDVLVWAVAFLLVARILRKATTIRWLVLGIWLGIGLLNKHSVLFLGFGLAVGLIATKQRRLLATPGPYIAAGMALALFLPHLLWQHTHGWPTLEFMENARRHKNFFTPMHFITGQVLEMNPVFLPLWIGGLAALFLDKRLQRFRVFGWIYVALLALFLVTKAKTYYLAPAYTILFAAGAVWLSRLRMRGLRPAVALVVLSAGVAIMPMSVPLLSPERYLAYQEWLGLAPPRMERHQMGAMPQHFAAMFGWDEIADATAGVVASLDESERQNTVILGANYGYAGVIELRNRRMPEKSVNVGGPHNSYWMWGPPQTKDGKEPQTLILVGFPSGTAERFCRAVSLAATTSCTHCLTRRTKSEIVLCRGPLEPLSQVWPKIKKYI